MGHEGAAPYGASLPYGLMATIEVAMGTSRRLRRRLPGREGPAARLADHRPELARANSGVPLEQLQAAVQVW
jgi:hypothetical protein